MQWIGLYLADCIVVHTMFLACDPIHVITHIFKHINQLIVNKGYSNLINNLLYIYIYIYDKLITYNQSDDFKMQSILI